MHAALWVHRSLPQKNRLITADAQSVEQTFSDDDDVLRSAGRATHVAQTEYRAKPDRSKPAQPKKKRSQPKGIDKSTLLLAEPRRICDREHVR